ncbi:MAG: hypothetical protein JRH15_18535 [Deltaproteobacteria bacterium]|nr:hypothetical protein [Deltaproteobacteria bacterium]
MNDIHDIKALVAVDIPISPAQIAMWGAAAVVLAALVWAAWYIRRRRKPKTAPVAPPLPPEQVADDRLRALAGRIDPDGKAFYFELSEIFREYLKGRFAIDGLEKTTEELMPCIEGLSVDRGLKREVNRFLVSADPIKFADLPVERRKMDADLAFVRTFVETTPPRTEESETNILPQESVRLRKIPRTQRKI